MKDGLLRILYWIIAGMLAAIPLSFLYYGVFSLFVYTEEEARLETENRLLRKEMPKVSKVLDSLEVCIDSLQKRDARIFRGLFNADIFSTDVLFEQYDRDPLVMAGRIEENLRYVTAALSDRSAVLPPLSFPLPVSESATFGASVGKKLNPFYKLEMYHDGLDIAASAGTAVLAVADGKVSSVKRSKGGKGNVVKLEHKGGYRSSYAHLDEIRVKAGQQVRAGTAIGTVGSSGRSFSPHLHYEMSRDTVILDPVHYLFGGISPEQYINILHTSALFGQSFD